MRKPRAPRFVLGDEMDARGWTIDYVVLHTELDKETLKHFLRGDRKVSEEIAVELGHLCGTSASYWLDLQHQYERGEEWK